MTESEFLKLADMTLRAIETALELAADNTEFDVECSRSGNVLEIEIIDNGSKVIVNSQTPMQEIWLAAKSGGFHYKRHHEQWINTRDGSELFQSLSAMLTAQSGCQVMLEIDKG